MSDKKQVIIKEEYFPTSVYSTKEWQLQMVDIIRWEHDFEKKQYVIDYKEK